MSDTIYYVVYDSSTYSFTPEIDTGGYNKQFPIGYTFTTSEEADKYESMAIWRKCWCFDWFNVDLYLWCGT